MVDILLATYNGEKYLKKQLDSIISQTFKEFKILIRDDGSTDKSLDIIKQYQKKYPSKIKLIKDNKKNLGPAQNFMTLIEHSTANYSMLCDQDDIWLENKVEISVNAIKKAEQKTKSKIPILAHTDLKVVDKNLKEISSSYFKMMMFNPNTSKSNRLIIRNIVTGCTIIINKPLREIAKKEACSLIHDHYLAIMAALFGKIIFINKQTILYRQHDNNVVGAMSGKAGFLKQIKRLINYRKRALPLFKQAQNIYNHHKDLLSDKQKNILKNAGLLTNMGCIKRRITIVKYSLYDQGFFRNLILFLLI